MASQRIISWVGILTGLGVIVGALCALLWARIVRLPEYVVNADHFADMSERGHAEVIAADAWFVVIGLVAGVILGSLAWSWFKGLGWPVALIAAGAGLVSGLICWGVGQLFGPGAFAFRLAQAMPGESVPIAFELHSPGALGAWVLGAVTPTLFLAALGPELADLRENGARGRGTAAVEDPAAESAPAEVS